MLPMSLKGPGDIQPTNSMKRPEQVFPVEPATFFLMVLADGEKETDAHHLPLKKT